MGGATGHPIPSKRATRQNQCCILVRHPGGVPRFQSPHCRRQPPRRSRRSERGEDSVRDSGPGAHEPLVSIHPAAQCSIPGRVRFPGRFQDCVLKCSMRPANLSLADRRFGSCGTAARRLRSSAATPGAPVEQYPHLTPVLARRAGIRLVDRETWSYARCHPSGFRVSRNPTSSTWQTHVVLTADW